MLNVIYFLNPNWVPSEVTNILLILCRKQIFQNTENNEERRSSTKVYHIASYRDSPVTYGKNTKCYANFIVSGL